VLGPVIAVTAKSFLTLLLLKVFQRKLLNSLNLQCSLPKMRLHNKKKPKVNQWFSSADPTSRLIAHDVMNTDCNDKITPPYWPEPTYTVKLHNNQLKQHTENCTRWRAGMHSFRAGKCCMATLLGKGFGALNWKKKK